MTLPGGMTYGGGGVATTLEIVACFDELEPSEILNHNWRTCPPDCRADWNPTTGTYINGVPLSVDYDYIVGYLIEAVDRETLACTYIAVVHYHGRRPDGTFEEDWMVWPGTHTFGKDDGYEATAVQQWAVEMINSLIDEREQR